MSDDRQQILALGVTPDDAHATGERLRDWLRARRFAVPHPDAVDAFPPNHDADGIAIPADLIGPGFAATLYGTDHPWYNPLSSFIYVQVPVDPDNRFWYAGGGTGPSDCRSCGVPMPEDEFWEAFNEWLVGPEPKLTCTNCGKTALMGDQDTSGSIVVSPVGIVVSPVGIVMSGDAWDLVGELLGALRTDFGGRWTWVNHHS